MSKTVYKVKYVGGSGIELPYPLSDGRSTIPGHTVISLENYADFVRLTASPLFVEVKDEATTPAPVEVTETQESAPAVERTKTDGKAKSSSTTEAGE